MCNLRLLQCLALLAVLLCPALVSAAVPEIQADKTYYDISTGLYMLEGNVTVRVKDALIQAPRARVSLTSMEVYAEGGVSFEQAGIRLRGDTVFVRGRECRAVLEGGINVEGENFSSSCTKTDFNWKTKDMVLYNATIYQDGSEFYANQAVYNVKTKTLQY